MTNKVHGFTVPGEFFGAGIDFVEITTGVDIRVASAGSAASQAALDKVIEVVSQRSQPIIIGAPYASGGNYILKVAVRAGTWTAASLEAQMIADQKSGMGFTSANTSIVVGETI